MKYLIITVKENGAVITHNIEDIQKIETGKLIDFLDRQAIRDNGYGINEPATNIHFKDHTIATYTRVKIEFSDTPFEDNSNKVRINFCDYK